VAPAAPLTDPALVSGLSSAGGTQTVVLTAPGKASTVKLELFASGSTTPSWTSTQHVGAGTQSAVVLPLKAGTTDAMLLVTPQSGGAVYAARRIDLAFSTGNMLATATLLPHRATAEVPGVASVPGSSVR
jgi:hypothetical protein